MTDFLDEKRQEITERLHQLKPVVDEYRRLKAAASALESVGGPGSSSKRAAPRHRKPGRPSASATRKPAAKTARSKVKQRAASRRPGRRKGSGTRAAEALVHVQGQPGITIPELAAKMGIKQNYLYRILPGLEQAGKIRTSGRGLDPVAPAGWVDPPLEWCDNCETWHPKGKHVR
jgi:hypothetical protein